MAMRKHPNKDMAMSNINQEKELDVLDSRILEEETKIEKHKALQVLFDKDSEAGKAFAIIILDGYAEAEADRICKAITTPDGMKREHIETAVDKLKGIRHLRAYLAMVELDAMHAVETLDDLKFTKNDIKANPGKYLDTED